LTCLSCQLDQVKETPPGTKLVTRLRSLVEGLIDLLDSFDADPDLEESADAEGSLGFLQAFPGQGRGCIFGQDDLEMDNADDEPSLGSHEARQGGVVSYLHRPINAHARCTSARSSARTRAFDLTRA
jgi:hypothetical protein